MNWICNVSILRSNNSFDLLPCIPVTAEAKESSSQTQLERARW